MSCRILGLIVKQIVSRAAGLDAEQRTDPCLTLLRRQDEDASPVDGLVLEQTGDSIIDLLAEWGVDEWPRNACTNVWNLSATSVAARDVCRPGLAPNAAMLMP